MGNARGIDGLAVFVNNQFVDNKETLDDISATSIEAEFVFTQVKRSASLDEGISISFVQQYATSLRIPRPSILVRTKTWPECVQSVTAY